jgi:hypothetical protein
MINKHTNLEVENCDTMPGSIAWQETKLDYRFYPFPS